MCGSGQTNGRLMYADVQAAEKGKGSPKSKPDALARKIETKKTQIAKTKLQVSRMLPLFVVRLQQPQRASA